MPFPQDRTVAATGPSALLGKDAESHSALAEVQGNALALPGGSGVQWAIYHFVPDGTPEHLDVTLDTTATSAAWIGIADYAMGRWRFFGPFSGPQTVALDGSNYVSPLGNFYAAVVIGPSGAAKIDQLQLFRWREVPVIDAGPYAGQGCSLAIVDGNPAISYWITTDIQQDTAELRYVRALDPTGSVWGTPVIPSLEANPGRVYTHLVVVNGNPAICYKDGMCIWFIRATDADGNAWSPPVLVDPLNETVHGGKLWIVNGVPAVTYIGHVDWGSGSFIEYTRALDPDGTSWGPPIVIDDLINDGNDIPSLVIANGNPALFYERNITDMRYVRANDPDGLIWPAPRSMGTSITGSFTSIAGHPAFAYLGDWPNIMYRRSMDTNGDSWSIPTIIANAAQLAPYSQLELKEVGGVPALLYIHEVESQMDNRVIFQQARIATGSSWLAPNDTAMMGNAVSWSDMTTLAAGQPAIAYCHSGDPGNGSLHFVARE